MSDRGIIQPGQTPPFPQSVLPASDSKRYREVSEADQTAIAEAAWKQSHGSIQAFEQLCSEHVAGQIDLLAAPADEGVATDEEPAPAPERRRRPRANVGGGEAPNTSGTSAEETGQVPGGGSANPAG